MTKTWCSGELCIDYRMASKAGEVDNNSLPQALTHTLSSTSCAASASAPPAPSSARPKAPPLIPAPPPAAAPAVPRAAPAPRAAAPAPGSAPFPRGSSTGNSGPAAGGGRSGGGNGARPAPVARGEPRERAQRAQRAAAEGDRDSDGVLRICATSLPKSVAGAVAHKIRDGQECKVTGACVSC